MRSFPFSVFSTSRIPLLNAEISFSSPLFWLHAMTVYNILPPFCIFYTPFYFIASTLDKLSPGVLLPLSCPAGVAGR